MLLALVAHMQIMRFGYKPQRFGADAIEQNTLAVVQRLLLSLTQRRKVQYSRVIWTSQASIVIDQSRPRTRSNAQEAQ